MADGRLRRGEVAPNVFRFLQKGAVATLPATFEAGAGDGSETALHAHVITRRGDANVSCGLYSLPPDGRFDPYKARPLDAPGGETTHLVVGTSSLGLPDDMGFCEAIRTAFAALEQHELELFAGASPFDRAAIREAFAKATGEILEGCED